MIVLENGLPEHMQDSPCYQSFSLQSSCHFEVISNINVMSYHIAHDLTQNFAFKILHKVTKKHLGQPKFLF